MRAHGVRGAQSNREQAKEGVVKGASRCLELTEIAGRRGWGPSGSPKDLYYQNDSSEPSCAPAPPSSSPPWAWVLKTLISAHTKGPEEQGGPPCLVLTLRRLNSPHPPPLWDWAPFLCLQRGAGPSPRCWLSVTMPQKTWNPGRQQAQLLIFPFPFAF